MHICTRRIVRIGHGCNIIDAVLSGNILWCRPGIVHFCSSRIVRGRLGRNACDVVCGWILPAIDRTDVVHCGRCWIVRSWTRSDLIDALRYGLV